MGLPKQSFPKKLAPALMAGLRAEACQIRITRYTRPGQAKLCWWQGSARCPSGLILRRSPLTFTRLLPLSRRGYFIRGCRRRANHDITVEFRRVCRMVSASYRSAECLSVGWASWILVHKVVSESSAEMKGLKYLCEIQIIYTYWCLRLDDTGHSVR